VILWLRVTLPSCRSFAKSVGGSRVVLIKIKPLCLLDFNQEITFFQFTSKRFGTCLEIFYTSRYIPIKTLTFTVAYDVIALAASNGKRNHNVWVWSPSVCPSIPSFFLTLVGHAARHILNVTYQGAARDANQTH